MTGRFAVVLWAAAITWFVVMATFELLPSPWVLVPLLLAGAGSYLGYIALSMKFERDAAMPTPPPLFNDLGPDPWLELKRRSPAATLHVGRTSTGWTHTKPRSNMLILGPSQSGKTSTVLVPQILLAHGAVVAGTTKAADLFRPTAQTRHRMGRLWHYNPSGTGGVLPGTTELCWSPINGCEVWDVARQRAKALVDIIDVSATAGDGNHDFFKKQSAQFIAPVLHVAALGGKDIMFVLRVIYGNKAAIKDVERILFSKGHELAQLQFGSYLGFDARLQSNITASAQGAFEAYATDASSNSARNSDFSVEAFVRSNDTIYITAPTDDQADFAPLYSGLLAQIRRARFALHAEEELQQLEPTEPMLWALDELASMAPMKELPSLISQSASQGLLVSACLQGLGQAKRIWGPISDEFISGIFIATIVFPGLGDYETRNSIASMGGKEWIQLENKSHSVTYTQGESFTTGRKKSGDSYTVSSGRSETWGTSTQWAQQARLTPGDVFQGNTGTVDKARFGIDSVIYITPGSVRAAQVFPYFRTPFRECLEVNREVYLLDNPTAELPSPSLPILPPKPLTRRQIRDRARERRAIERQQKNDPPIIEPI